MTKKPDSTTNRDRYGPGIAMTDLATNLLGVFICLFMLAFLMMSKKVEEVSKNKAESKAEFLITVSWDKDADVDIDTYVEDPLANIVSFRSREKGLMHLDRDDIGTVNDNVTLSNGQAIVVKENREIVAIRGIIPGEYTVNGHMYSNRQKLETVAVTIRLDKVNPSFKMVTQKEIVLKKVGDEITAFRFTIDAKGDVTSTNDLQKEIAHYKNYQGQSSSPEGEEGGEYNLPQFNNTPEYPNIPEGTPPQ